MPGISFFYGISIYMCLSPSSRFPSIPLVEQLLDIMAVEVVGDH